MPPDPIDKARWFRYARELLAAIIGLAAALRDLASVIRQLAVSTERLDKPLVVTTIAPEAGTFVDQRRDPMTRPPMTDPMRRHDV